MQSGKDEALIVRGILRMARALRRSVPAGEISGSALSLLVALHDGGPMSAVALAQRVDLQPQSLSRLIAHLDKHGFIERSVDPGDRRRHVIILTEHGTMALRRAIEMRREWLAQILAKRLDAGERQLLAQASELLIRITMETALE